MYECFWRLLVAFPLTVIFLSLFGIYVFCFVPIKICIIIIITIDLHRHELAIDIYSAKTLEKHRLAIRGFYVKDEWL